MEPYEEIALVLIRQARRNAGISQAELSRRSGISVPVLSAYENGRRQPSVAALARIVEACGQELALQPRLAPYGSARAAHILEQVLDLADALPYEPRPELAYPPLVEQVV
jgi:transcriptional regulator with XRE-family HTH domain